MAAGKTRRHYNNKVGHFMKINQYNIAQEQLQKLRDRKTKVCEKKDKELHILHWKYSDMIRDLKHEKLTQEKALETIYDTILNTIKEKSKPYSELRDKVHKIFNLIDIYTGNIFLFLTPDKDLPLLINDIKDHERAEFERRLKNELRHLEPLDIYIFSNYDEQGHYCSRRKVYIPILDMIADDDFKKIAVYIVENDKPVNKYSLKRELKTIFSSSNFIPRSTNILREGPNKKVLTEWYNKNRYRIHKESLSVFEPLEQDYIKAIELFKKTEWRLAYMKHQKYYYENHYSHGTETKEYKKVLKEIKRLKEISQRNNYGQKLEKCIT